MQATEAMTTCQIGRATEPSISKGVGALNGVDLQQVHQSRELFGERLASTPRQRSVELTFGRLMS
jgi:hypothetical protein